MIIVDLNQVMISNFMAQVGNHTNITIDENLFRHMVLNSIRSYNQKFKAEYGEMVIACDAGNNWRRDVFPYYKANRKKARQKSDVDWNTVFESLNKVRDELRDYFPYRVIHIDKAEADDIIGTLCAIHGDNEPVMIVSGDKDFRQLQVYKNVKQYDPVRKRMIADKDPKRYLKEHIMRGDMGDGVPNFLSKDDTFVVGGRQKPLREEKLNNWIEMDPSEFCDDEMFRNYKRNEILVDLSMTPQSIKDQVVTVYNEQAGKTRAKLFNYFIDNKLKHLMESINEF